MANRHYKKWWIQMPVGFVFISAGIFAIVFSLDKRPNDEWPIWVAIAIVAFNLGLAFLGSALIHKLKSDLIRRDRAKYRTGPPDEF